MDAAFDKGRPPGPVRMGSGEVTATATDTLTVDMHGETIPGVAVQGGMPAVGAQVDVFNLDDLLYCTGLDCCQLPAAVCLDLTTAVIHYDADEPSDFYGSLVDGELVAETPYLSVHFPDVLLTDFDRAKTYRLTVTFTDASGTDQDFVLRALPENTLTSWQEDSSYLIGGLTNNPGAGVTTFTFGWEGEAWPEWNEVPTDWEGLTFDSFSTNCIVESICWSEE
jgi:hypothetical protein